MFNVQNLKKNVKIILPQDRQLKINKKEIKSINSNTEDKGYLFEINTNISTNYSLLNKNYLIKLGSYGLFNRLNLLNNIEAISD